MEKGQIRSSSKGVDRISEQTDKPVGASTKQNAFIDEILIFQGATPTDANRQNLINKIESIQQHRN